MKRIEWSCNGTLFDCKKPLIISCISGCSSFQSGCMRRRESAVFLCSHLLAPDRFGLTIIFAVPVGEPCLSIKDRSISAGKAVAHLGTKTATLFPSLAGLIWSFESPIVTVPTSESDFPVKERQTKSC